MSSPLATLLSADEGARLRVYDDATGRAIGPGTLVVGHPTIGIGRCLDTHGITAAEQAMLLANDIAAVQEQCGRLAWWVQLDAVRQDAVAAMAFQMGFAGMLTFKSMIASLSMRDYRGAVAAIGNSKWAKETPVRAKQVSAMLETGCYPAP